jgi:hypothetical protein
VDSRKYVAFPRFSMSTNMGDQGEHFARQITHLTAPLSLARRRLLFGNLDSSIARYDQFLEIEPSSLKRVVPSLERYEFDVDLTGSKQPKHLNAPSVLTIRKGVGRPMLSCGLKHYPPELNVLFEEPGELIGLYPRENIDVEQNDTVTLLRSFFYQP